MIGQGRGLSGCRGRTFDDIHTLEADNIGGASMERPGLGFWPGPGSAKMAGAGSQPGPGLNL